MQDERYNGWANYPTWVTALWIDNDPGTYGYRCDMRDEIIANVRSGELVDVFGKPLPPYGAAADSAMILDLANALKDWVEDELVRTDDADLSTDLIGFALGMVDWGEIAENWLSEVKS